MSHTWLRRCKNILQINSFAFIFYLSALVAKFISNILKACGRFILVDTMPPSGYFKKNERRFHSENDAQTLFRKGDGRARERKLWDKCVFPPFVLKTV